MQFLCMPAETREPQLQPKGPFYYDRQHCHFSICPLESDTTLWVFQATPLCAGYLSDESHNKGTTFTLISSGHNDFHSAQPRHEVPPHTPTPPPPPQGDQRGLCDLESELLAPSLLDLPADPTSCTPFSLALPGLPSLILRAWHL